MTLGIFASAMARANDAHHAAAPSTNETTTQASDQAGRQATSMAQGEVKKVNKDAGKITLKHGELKNLDMPPMTMVFRVKDPAMLEQLKAGDRINFVAEKIGGQLTVTQFEIIP